MASNRRDDNRVPNIAGVSSVNFLGNIEPAVDPSTHELLVVASVSPGSMQDVNLIKVGGTSFALGQQLAAASLPVVLTASQLSTLTPLTSVAVTQSTSPWVISGTVTANAGTGNFTVVQPTGTNLHVVIDAGSAVLGHVITDSGSVTNATLSAETTKVIGVVRNADGAGNLLTSNSTATSGKIGLDMNILSILGTAPTTAGFLDIKGADGNVFVRQTTGSNLHVQVDAGSAVIGHVISDSGSVTNATLQTQTDTVMVGGFNIKEINAVTPLMGNGVTGTGSLRVTVASDNTAFAVNATLSAETTKVIGTVNQGTSPWVTSGTVTANAGTGTFNTKLTPSATATLSNVAGSASSVTLLASNTSRLGATIVNDSTAQLYVKFGSTASTTSYTYTLFQFDQLEVPFGYTAIITGIWASATGNARVTEYSA